MPFLIAQISDPHFDLGDRATARATAVMDYLRGLPVPPDALLVTGDIADHGHPDEYRLATKVLSAPFPTLMCPGNHDVRSAYQQNLAPEPHQARYFDGLTIALMDSSIPGRDDGDLDQATLVWLDGVLAAAPDVPALIGMHHPPVELGVPAADAIRQLDSDGLNDVLDCHPQVIAVLCGHAHTGAATAYAGRPLLVAPGIVSTAMLPWERPGEYFVDLDLPPSIALHVVDGNRITTHYRVVPMK